MIPKVIHLCWLSGDPYPAKIARCIESWKKFLPDYEVMLWDTQRFDLSKCPWVNEAFKHRKYAFAADYLRFYALYHYGGIYLDSDVEVLKSFNNLLHLPYFMGNENAGTIEAAVMGAEKGLPWVKQCLDYYEGRHFEKEDGTLDIHKLPEIMCEVLSKTGSINELSLPEAEALLKDGTYASNNCIHVFPSEFFSPKVFDLRCVRITPHTYTIHHYQNSWFSPKAKLYYRLRAVAIRLVGYRFITRMERLLLPGRFHD